MTFADVVMSTQRKLTITECVLSPTLLSLTLSRHISSFLFARPCVSMVSPGFALCSLSRGSLVGGTVVDNGRSHQENGFAEAHLMETLILSYCSGMHAYTNTRRSSVV
ncbi:hypothetical protein BAUCODRAFT_419610 [Baudoinia panamericana UAMH 10762]|uniref:Uncharacterized protein n=1 Tax=Baudoinia panamericana (strain UAMH 10762) TaxID=717646 RepID=M2MNL9_BAUPA|nr:uncharacterized protein BAUCODRAFT_419610 [Baudoinia panamericana UAMH 10762]EMC98281.1 hypothetical protein BAUCODRAFT_419610 [Baudoinia panamericana UAMH 10762]